MLKKGSKGKSVQNWQQWLNRYGFGAGAADGIYGNKTWAAVKRFQKKARIKSDGIIGRQTENARKHWRTLPVRVIRKVGDKLRRLWPKRKWAYLVIHYSVTRGGDAALIYRLHRARGWTKGGYHAVIKQDGTIQTGDQFPQYLRRSTEVGAHTKNHNYHAFGVCVLTMDKPNAKQLAALKEYVKMLHRKGVGFKATRGHKEMPGAATSCPGRWNFRALYNL